MQRIVHIIAAAFLLIRTTSTATASDSTMTCSHYCDVSRRVCTPGPRGRPFCRNAREMCNQCRKEQSPIIVVEEPNFEDAAGPCGTDNDGDVCELQKPEQVHLTEPSSTKCLQYCDVSQSGCLPDPVRGGFCMIARRICNECRKEQSPIIVVEEPNFEDAAGPCGTDNDGDVCELQKPEKVHLNEPSSTKCLQYCDVSQSGCLPDPVPGGFCMLARRICNECRKEQSSIIVAEEPNFDDRNVPSPSACLKYCERSRHGCPPGRMRILCLRARDVCNRCKRRYGQRFSQVYASETGKPKNTSIDFVNASSTFAPEEQRHVPIDFLNASSTFGPEERRHVPIDFLNASSTFGPEERRHVPIHFVNTSHTPGPEKQGNITTDIANIFPSVRLEEQAKVLIEFTNATLGVLTNTLPAHDDQKQFLINSVDVILLNTLSGLTLMTRWWKSVPEASKFSIAAEIAIEELTQYRQQLLQQPLMSTASSYDALSKAQTEPPAESIDKANSDDQEMRSTDGHDVVSADLVHDMMVDELMYQLQRYLLQTA